MQRKSLPMGRQALCTTWGFCCKGTAAAAAAVHCRMFALIRPLSSLSHPYCVSPGQRPACLSLHASLRLLA